MGRIFTAARLVRSSNTVPLSAATAVPQSAAMRPSVACQYNSLASILVVLLGLGCRMRGDVERQLHFI